MGVRNHWNRMRMYTIRRFLDPCPRRHVAAPWGPFGSILQIRTCERCCRILEMGATGAAGDGTG